MQTTGISLQPVYEVSKINSNTLKEYRATNMVSFQVKTEQAGSIIDGAIDNGASRIDGLSFLPKPEDLQKARLEALKLAVADAKLQATTVLTALNLKEKEVITIHVDESALAPLQLQRSEVSFTAKTAVVGGDAVVRGRVSLQIRY
ncbi:MAG: SIMPL domain-containing protein [Leptonema sp. (in: Bacteria)]|nr:SIMPL domain-containing protein [Leptonema sp. (in: bacteria)]